MKNIQFLTKLFCFLVFSACQTESIDTLKGTYKVDYYNFESANNPTTDKLGQGIKAIHLLLSADDNLELDLVIGSREWYITEGTYTMSSGTLMNKQYIANFNNGNTIKKGDLDITLVNGVYHFVGILETTQEKLIKITFRGEIQFIEGTDDPEPSGYTFKMSTSEVTVTDWNTGQTTNYPELTKYSFSVSDPDGKHVALFDAINKTGLNVGDLEGSYTLQGNPAEPWLMDQGWSMPQYFIAGGTFFTDENEIIQYASMGKISFSLIPVINGDTLYTIQGDQLGLRTYEGVESQGNCLYKYLIRLQ